MTTLYWTAAESGAAAALAALTGRPTVLVATPTAYTVAVREPDGRLRTPDPWALPDATFQLTAFDGTVELRWLADGDTGRAVWLAEDAAALPDTPTGSLPVDDVVAARIVLWGLPAAGDRDGFSAWSDGRIGAAAYPTPPGVGRHERACLDAVEYVAFDAHGNAAVVERRLIGIVTADARSGR